VTEPIRWTRAALEARVDALEERHSHQELIDAIVEFADTLTEEDRRSLQDVLLKRRRPAHLRLRRPSDPPSEER
jgi:uncharacterized coiled-coil protein SlyX